MLSQSNRETKGHKRFLDVFKNHTSPTPVWLMRQAGRYLPEYRALRMQEPDFVKFCMTPSLAIEATLQPLRRFPLDAAILFSDILTILKAHGADLTFVESKGPQLTCPPLPQFIETSKTQTIKNLSPVFDIIRALRDHLSDDVALIGFAGAPWTLMCYLLNGKSSTTFENAKDIILKDFSLSEKLCDVLTDLTIQYLLEQIKSGAEVIQIFDSWSGVLPYSWVDSFLLRPWKRIASALKSAFPDVPIIAFVKGAGVLLPTFVDAVDVDAVSLDSSVPIPLALSLPERLVIQGGMDPAYVVRGGSVMRAEARRYLDAFKERSYIFNLGHGVPMSTPAGHVDDLIRFVRAERT
ncbi:MAG: uroporphyrinogen decarboxylase [Candidatus Nucleicultricaceae bacterium]